MLLLIKVDKRSSFNRLKRLRQSARQWFGASMMNRSAQKACSSYRYSY